LSTVKNLMLHDVVGMQSVCSIVTVDTEKSVLKQGAVQHLYGRLSGRLHDHCNDSHLLVTGQLVSGPHISTNHRCTISRITLHPR